MQETRNTSDAGDLTSIKKFLYEKSNPLKTYVFKGLLYVRPNKCYPNFLPRQK